MPKRQPPPRAPAHARDTSSRRSATEVRSVRLTRKLAQKIDGIDLSGADVGDRLDLTQRDAGVLIAEGWARPLAADAPRRRLKRRSR